MHLYCLFIWLVLTLVLVKPAVSCPYQECFCSSNLITCHGRALTQFPTLVASTGTYSRLRMTDNQITSIPDNSLPANLQEIDFSGNPISTISPSAFNDSASTLTVLTFSNAKLTSLPSALRVLTNLQSLTLANSPIQNWPLDVLQGIGNSLNTLTLDNVGLTSFPDWLDYLPHLATLTLSNNPVASVPDSALDQKAGQLWFLGIISANLSSITTVVSSLRLLGTLDLHDNDIQEVANLPRNGVLGNLYLNRNNISDRSNTLSQELGYFADTLTYLYMNENKLTSIPDLSNMKQLSMVSLRDNLISDTVSGALSSSISLLDVTDNQLSAIPEAVIRSTGLTRLIIANNRISDISAVDIPDRLTLLDISGNSISQVTDTAFPAGSSLKTLDLSDNPISAISLSAFSGLSGLTKLQLKGTQLARVPLALNSLVSLTSLDLTNNQNLVCTCQESSLTTWFASVPSLDVKGQCGDVAVRDFYDNLASHCPAQS